MLVCASICARVPSINRCWKNPIIFVFVYSFLFVTPPSPPPAPTDFVSTRLQIFNCWYAPRCVPYIYIYIYIYV